MIRSEIGLQDLFFDGVIGKFLSGGCLRVGCGKLMNFSGIFVGRCLIASQGHLE